jgi:uncharacterized membrane protein
MNKIGFNFLLFIIIYVYYVLIDGTMIFLYTGKAFGDMIKTIQKGEPMKTRMLPGILCFFVLAFGYTYFVLPKIRDEAIVLDSLKYGAVFGLVVYAVYDLTNLSTFSKYATSTAIIDMIWGGILGFIVSVLGAFTRRRFQKLQESNF